MFIVLIAEAAKEEEAEDDDDMDGFQTDDEDEDGSGFDKEMGVDADDGDDGDTITLRKLAEQVSGYAGLKNICLHMSSIVCLYADMSCKMDILVVHLLVRSL